MFVSRKIDRALASLVKLWRLSGRVMFGGAETFSRTSANSHSHIFLQLLFNSKTLFNLPLISITLNDGFFGSRKYQLRTGRPNLS